MNDNTEFLGSDLDKKSGVLLLDSSVMTDFKSGVFEFSPRSRDLCRETGLGVLWRESNGDNHDRS